MPDVIREQITEADLEQARQGRMIINPNGNEAKELRKWEQHHGHPYGGPPGHPYTYTPFPKMLYRAQRDADGKVKCMKPEPHISEFRMSFDPAAALRAASEDAANFTRACQKIVDDERAYQAARESGWCESPQEAVDHALALERVDGVAAAERTYRDRNMSDAAKAEAASAEAEAAPFHLPDIAEKRRKPMSAEARAAAGERLKQARLAKRAKQSAA